MITADGIKDLKMNLLKTMKSFQDFHLFLYIFLMGIKKFAISKHQSNNSYNQMKKMHLILIEFIGSSLI
jgi:hypothetical protein